MESFLITFKPANESPERGWPREEFQSLLERYRRGDRREKWRFRNRRAVSLGDRVFLLLQGGKPPAPAIIGYGRVVGRPEEDADGSWRALIEFDDLVDPSVCVLASKEHLRGIEGGQSSWNTQFSGRKLSVVIAAELEALVMRNSRWKPTSERGNGLTALCSSCGKPKEASKLFCHHCGHRNAEPADFVAGSPIGSDHLGSDHRKRRNAAARKKLPIRLLCVFAAGLVIALIATISWLER